MSHDLLQFADCIMTAEERQTFEKLDRKWYGWGYVDGRGEVDPRAVKDGRGKRDGRDLEDYEFF